MKQAIVILLLLGAVNVSLGQNTVFVKSGEAIRGYDPVAYFKENKPVKGNDSFTFSWQGAKWKFASQQNLNDFKSDPEKYAPQFGGYCAYGVSDNHKAPTSPEAWTIVNGKLYLNYDTDVQKLWKEDQQMHIQQANKNWPTVKLEKD
jgi:YHS domain-containing protein